MIQHTVVTAPDEFDPFHYLIWRVRAAEHHVYCSGKLEWTAKWYSCKWFSGIFSPGTSSYPWLEVVADEMNRHDDDDD